MSDWVLDPGWEKDIAIGFYAPTHLLRREQVEGKEELKIRELEYRLKFG